MVSFEDRKVMGDRAITIGYALLLWGLVDRPPIMIVAAAFLIAGYAAVGQSVPNGEREAGS